MQNYSLTPQDWREICREMAELVAQVQNASIDQVLLYGMFWTIYAHH